MYSQDMVTSAAVIDRIKSELKNPANRIEGSFAADNAQAVGKEIAKTYAYIQWLHKMHYVETAVGEYLDRKAIEVGIRRKMAQWARGYVTFTGEPGTVIPFDFAVRSETKEYRTLEEGAIGDSGRVILPIEATVSGPDGNLPSGAISLSDRLYGLREVTNEEAIVGGTEEEGDEPLRERTLLRMRYPGTSGNQYHYMHWALEVDGVGRVKVFPLWDGPGTVKVSILDANQRIASQELITAVIDHIDPEPRKGEGLAPIGAYLTVSTAEEVIVDISAEVITSLNAETKEVIAEEYRIQAQAYFDAIAYGETKRITVAKMIDILWNVPGIENILNFTMNGGGDNIALEPEEIAKVGQVTIL